MTYKTGQEAFCAGAFGDDYIGRNRATSLLASNLAFFSRALHAATVRYLLVAEYYNPVPVAIDYRGHSNRLFKRDFCGEIMDRHPDLRLVDYGFAYRRDPSFPQDDITWFLLEKTV